MRLFLKTCAGNIFKSTLVCLLAGGVHYLFIPREYVASATIEMAKVAGEMVETPNFLLEKIKIPSYFTHTTLQICDPDGKLNSQANFAKKINPSINKSVPFISFVTHAQTTRQAIACLNAVIAEISSNQNAIAKPLLEQKKRNLQQLQERLKHAEEQVKLLSTLADKKTPNEEPFSGSNSAMCSIYNLEINKTIRNEIIALEYALSANRTQPVSLVNSVYASEAPINKRPFFTLCVSLVLGLILGLLVTAVMREGRLLKFSES